MATPITQSYYRQIQLSAITNQNGTSIWEVQAATSMGWVIYCFWKEWGLNTAVAVVAPSMLGQFQSFVFEFVAVILPQLLAFTFPYWIATIVALFLFAALVMNQRALHSSRHSRIGEGLSDDDDYKEKLEVYLNQGRKGFIDMYRSLMMSMTCIAILAVDFWIFPRRFAKTESFGTSVMDIGVGAVIFSGSIINGRSLLSRKRTDLLTSLRKTLGSSLPLAVLGLVRLSMVKGLDYQEHVSEYGVHWNFFMTLTFLPLLVCFFVASGLPARFFGCCGLLLALLYQSVLSFTNLQSYLISDDRDPSSLLSLNKEGVFSLTGYLAIYLVGMQVGSSLLERKSLAQWKNLLMNLCIVDLFLWLLLYSTLFLKVSRRMANLPYILWVLASNLLHLLVLLSIDLAYGPTAKPSLITRAINRNQLACFLLGNALTGLINMQMKTLLASDIVAMSVLTAYLFALMGTMALLDLFQITLKFW